MVKKGIKRKHSVVAKEKDENVVVLPPKRISDEEIPKKTKWINKQRILIFASRGISFRDRHLMEDLKKLMPHHKPEAKMERSKTLSVVNEMCEMKHCNKAMMFEGRKKKDLYMWLSNVPNGPSVKFLVENIYTMAELKLTGNCLRGSRPLLSFDPTFLEKPHFVLLKELLTQIFGVPNHHPKSQPFFDHIYTFTLLDNRIWFRNFQILNAEGALAEVGPRFLLNPVKIFSGSFGGTPLWDNPHYLSPNKHRMQINLAAKNKYVNRQEQKLHAEATKPKDTYQLTPLQDVFKGDVYEQAEKITQELKEITNGKGNSLEETQKNKKEKKIKKKNVTEDEAEESNDSEDEDLNNDSEDEDLNNDSEDEDFVNDSENEEEIEPEEIQKIINSLKKKTIARSDKKGLVLKKSPKKSPLVKKSLSKVKVGSTKIKKAKTLVRKKK